MTVLKFFKEQSEALEKNLSERLKVSAPSLPVITIAMEPGSGGSLIAEKVAQRLDYRLYGKNILVAMANKSNIKADVLDAIEKGRPTSIEDFVSSILPSKNYLYRGDYCVQLKETLNNLAMLGKAVIVGRGANFIIPPEKRFAIRVICPRKARIKNVAFYHKVTLEEAERRITKREKRRKKFIKETFHEKINECLNYDLTINTQRMDLETCTELIIGAIKGSQTNHPFEKSSSYFLRSQA
jgi:cytidylate kinase